MPLTPNFFPFNKICKVSWFHQRKKLSRVIKSSRFYRRSNSWFQCSRPHKWDLGRAPSDVTSGTEVKHSRDFCWAKSLLWGLWKHFCIVLWFIFYRNRTRFLRERTVSSSITVWSLARDSDDCDVYFFFPFRSAGRQRRLSRYNFLPGSGSTICRSILGYTVQVMAVELTYSSERVIKMLVDRKSQ